VPEPNAEPPVEAKPAKPKARRASLWAVVERELLRTARRWQTYAMRAAFAAGLLTVVVVYWATQVSDAVMVDRQSLAQSGQIIFALYVWTQFLVLGALTPIVVAQSIIEEREGRTLDLLAITRLSPGRLLWGKLLSRVIALELLILAGMPVMAICMSLGGVELVQLANVVCQMTTLVLSAGAVAAFMGLYAKGPFSPAIGTWIWMFFAWTMGALPHGAASGFTEGGFAWTSPFLSLTAQTNDLGLVGPLLTWIPVTILTVMLAAAGFRAMVANADDPLGGFGTLSKDFAGLRRAKTALAILVVALLAATPLVVFQQLLSSTFPPVRALSWIWNIGWLVLGTGVWLLAARFSYIRLARRRAKRHRPGWKRLTKTWRKAEAETTGMAATPEEAAAWEGMLDQQEQAPPTVPGATGRDLSGKPVEVRVVARRPRFAPVRNVWNNPVAWRETVTRAHGGLSRSIVRAYVVLGVLVGFLFFIGAFSFSPLAPLAAAVASYFMAGLVVLMTATASIAGELRSKTLELLCATRMSSVRILWGKLFSSGLLVAPAWTAGTCMLFLGIMVWAREPAWDTYREFELAGWLLRAAGLSAWTGLGLLTVANLCHWIGLRARSASRVWLWTVGLAATWVIGPWILLAISDGSDIVLFVVGWINPLISEQLWQRPWEVPIQLFVAVGVWGVVALALFIDNVRGLARRAIRQ